MPLHIQTPLLRSAPLSRQLGQNVWLKMEALQPCGSFKLRGVGAVCESHYAAGARRFVSSSGGNAGIAVAYCGHALGVPVLVVVPETTSPRARELIRREGAELLVHGQNWFEANAMAQTLLGPTDAFVHPFDHPVLWQGHATLVDEMAAGPMKPDAVVLSVGGGGLLCGVLEGLQRNQWSDVPVLAVETVGADCFAQSVKAGHAIELAHISSVATSLGARQPCQGALDWATRHEIHTLVVSDQEAVAAALAFMEDQRIVVEPACGAALAAMQHSHPLLRAAHNIAVIVCGGVTVTDEQLRDLGRRNR